MEVFGEKLCDVFEARDILGIDGHQGLVRFEAGPRDLLMGGIDGFRHAGLQVFRQFEFTRGQFEKVHCPEIFQQFPDAFGGVQQLDAPLGGRAIRIQLDAKPGQDAEEGAIHQHASLEFNDEMGIALLVQSFQKCFKIGAAREVGATADFDPSDIFPDKY